MRPLLALAIAAALALPTPGVLARAGGAGAAPEAPATEAASALPVPVWNSHSGKLEAVLWIDTAGLPAQAGNSPALGLRWSARDGLASGSLTARLDPGLGLLCGQGGSTVDRLSEQCLVTQLNRPALPTGQVGAQANVRIGRSEWTGYSALRRSTTEGLLPGTSVALHMPELLPLAGAPGLSIEQQDLGIVGELRLGQQGWVRVGGTIARARLMPADAVLPGSVAPSWNSRTLSVGGGYGDLGGEVVGRVVRVPGDPEAYGTLGLGVTWRTPWSARLTVGAQNLLSTGENPITPRTGDEREEGRVPYVRYQQDL